jgi:hypothetical protein
LLQALGGVWSAAADFAFFPSRSPSALDFVLTCLSLLLLPLFLVSDVENQPVYRTHLDVVVNTRDMWESFTPAFEACVVEAKASSVMCSYNAMNGVPTCADPNLLNGILRNRWNFQGFVVSDYDAWANLVKTHHECPGKLDGLLDAALAIVFCWPLIAGGCVCGGTRSSENISVSTFCGAFAVVCHCSCFHRVAACHAFVLRCVSDMTCAAAQGINAGMDQEGGGNQAILALPYALGNKTVAPATISMALRRLMRTRIALGMLDPPTLVQPFNCQRTGTGSADDSCTIRDTNAV